MVASKDLDALIGGAPAPAEDGISDEMVRKLLTLNPALRNQGMNTESTVTMMQRARGSAAAAATSSKPAVAARVSESAGGVITAVREMQTKLAAGRAEIDSEMAALHKRRASLNAEALAAFTAWLEKNDADVRSPVTQKVIEREKTFFNDIGFTIDGYVDRRMKKR